MLIQVNEDNDICWVCNLSECGSGEWFDVTFCDPEIVCLSRCGAIVTVCPANGVSEVVGEFDHGLEAAQWSPDREVLLLVTFVENEEGGKNSVLLSMNGQWEVLAEATIEPHVSCRQGEESRVSLCWRPDSTLCAVSALDAADQTRRIRTFKRETLELHSVGRSEDGSGKVVPNLLSHIAWAGGGCSNLISSVQCKGKRTQQVVFLEPNGLRHREFPLRPEGPNSAHATVLGLDWNVESDLLAVTLQEEMHDKVQLWHRSNYHWYLKQELRYPFGQIACTRFDDEHSYILYVGLKGEGAIEVNWREYEFRWDTSSIQTFVDPSPQCAAVSIDGCLLNFTPLDKALVPPPMYAACVSMDRPIREVAFAAGSSDSVTAVAYLSDGSFSILANREGGRSQMIANYSPPTIICKAIWASTEYVDVTSLRQVLIVGSSETSLELIAIACGDPNEQQDRLVELNIAFDGGGGSIIVQNSITLEGRVLRMVHWLDNVNGALLELNDGSLLEYSRDASGEGHVLPSEAEPLLEPCPWIGALHNASVLDQGERSHSQRLVVGLSSRSRLYCQDRLLADAASSFILSPAHHFLCYATADTRSLLKFLPLKELHNFDPLMGSDENHLLEGYEPRNVERGTRLVAILPKNPMAILQMPRGNMEGIYPRALVLPFVMSNIDQKEYGEAFGMMRRQKVDLNLIVDLEPRRFLESEDGVGSFLEQVIPVDYLNLFISCLQDVDVTQFRYRIPSWFERTSSSQDNDASDFDFTTKVNQVCRKLRAIMIMAERNGQTRDDRTVSEGHFLLPVLSTFAKESPPKLEEALTLIKENAVSLHPPSSRKPPLFSDKAQSSIQYLAFLADYEMLFNTALGMYDYELARAVARNSQKDPKVYLPLLKRLRSSPEFYGKYEVDVRLHRYKAALSNLVMSGTNSEDLSDVSPPDDPANVVGNGFEQCMMLIEAHELHRLGLELFQADPDKHQQIIVSLGNQLLKKGQAETALAVFLAAEPPHLDGARQAARSYGDWRVFFTLPPDGDANEESIDLRNRRLAYDIAEEIASGKEDKTSRRTALADAARILLEYSQDIVGSVDMLISAEMWSEGRRIASLHSRQDLVKKCVDACVSYAYGCLEDFEERITSFTKANKRYVEMLTIRKAAIRESGLAPGEEHHANVDDAGSLFSVASNASLRSNMSGSSVGSVSSSVSSVISVGTQSTFTITSEHDMNRHKSKFNKIGKDKKKKKKKTGKKNKVRPGSEEELKSLVSTLKSSCVDLIYCGIIADMISFLGQVGKLDLAREVFEGYNTLNLSIATVQKERFDLAAKEKEDHERKARRERVEEPFLVLDVEREVDSFDCAELPSSLHELFSYLRC
jgi:elongator complex protein 1